MSMTKSTRRSGRFDEMPRGVPRAPRYSVQLHAYYRGAPADAWHEATTINMSRTGVLFTTADALRCGTPLELRVEIDIGPAEAPVIGTIECQCRTIRVEPPRVAARIERYAFRRGAPSLT
jgi:hypothetical protein